MCGIVGQINLNNQKVFERNIRKMMNAIKHRGPDDSGICVKGHVGIGFQRLSIIDTAGGHQPIYNEDQSIVLVTNGEIYNYHDLKDKMIAKGHTFKTRSDIEVILHLYEEYGEQFIEYLNGMFALCLYDIEKNKLLLARDRMGIKPLYYFQNKTTIYFSSEIKGILASREVPIAKEDDVLEEYLFFRFLSNNRTFFKNILLLEPGEIFISNHGQVYRKKYYNNNYNYLDFNDKYLIDEIYNKLNSSVKMQLMSDVPLGTFLSGGIDSSFVSAIAALNNTEIKTFTVGFEEENMDESPYAKIISRKFNTDYHEIIVDNISFTDILPKTIWYYDEPLNHANSVQIYLLCKYAKQYVKVLLTGEGADELFGGYPRYSINKIGVLSQSMGALTNKIIINILSLIKSRKFNKLTNLLNYSLEDMITMNSSFINKSYLTDNVLLTLFYDFCERKKVLYEITKYTEDYLNQLLLFEQKTYLQSILLRTDKMSMAASLEARVPFLDNHLIAFANSIKGSRKIRNFKTKYLLKESSKKFLPNTIVNRKKVGFDNPIDIWLRNPKGLGRYLDQVLDDRDIAEKIPRDKLQKLIMEHRRSTANHAEILWPIINYSIWNNLYF